MQLVTRFAVVAALMTVLGAARADTQATSQAAEDDLPKSLAEAVTWEAADALPRTDFYKTPKTLTSTRPGALLRKAAFDGYSLPKGAHAIRILYHSLDDKGRDVATSGVVLIPAGKAPQGGWPVIAWAHGTSGVATACAPSLMKDVYYGDEGLMPMVAAGFAVVATDYHGLGTGGAHQYVNKIAQAHDVIYSIPAARQAVKSLGKRWVVDGHSQGGLAAWGVDELEKSRRDPGFVAAVAVSPAVGWKHLSSHLTQPGAAAFYLDYIAYAIKQMTPTFKPADMLTGAPLQRYHEITTKGCWYYAYASYLEDKSTPVLKAGWEHLPAVRRLFNANAVGASLDKPMLVISGTGDHSVPVSAVRAAVARTCRRPNKIAFQTYKGLDHDPTMTVSTPSQLSWIKDRLAGKPVAKGCGREVHEPVPTSS